MCFLSWIEKDGQLFFLTDREVFSPRGRKIFGKNPLEKGNELLGQAAIRRYYGNGNGWMRGGVTRGVWDFWKEGVLPPKLVALVADFDCYWGWMWDGGAFQEDDFRYIFRHAPDEWRGRACEKLLGLEDVSSQSLRCIIERALDPQRERAWKILLERKDVDDHLRLIIIDCQAPDEWRGRACEKLLERGITEQNLRTIVCYGPEEWREKAWDLICERKSELYTFMCIVQKAPNLWRERAWKVLLDRKVMNDVLFQIIVMISDSDQWREKIWDLLLERGARSDIICNLYGSDEWKRWAKKELARRNRLTERARRPDES
jgi:hypothetical protein